jgi:hypothetical protein
MEIWNRSKNNLLCRAKEAKGIIGRAKGLMFREKLDLTEGILLKFHVRGNIVHTFFMRFAIDLIFLDSQKHVVELHSLKPWKFYKPKKRCYWLIEVNEGIIKSKNLEIGDKIEFLS